MYTLIQIPWNQGLQRVDIPVVCQQGLKGITIKLLPTYELNEVGIQLGPVC